MEVRAPLAPEKTWEGNGPRAKADTAGARRRRSRGLEVTQVAGASVCSGGWGPKSQVGVRLWPWSTTLQ